MALMTQLEIEERMYNSGIERAENSFKRAEERGAADTAPYAKELLRNFVLPVADIIATDLQVRRAGARQAHVALLAGFDTEAIAFLAVRAALNTCMHGVRSKGAEGTKVANERNVGASIGTAVHRELVLTQIADKFPELYYTLDRDLGRRQSKDETHRINVMKAQARKEGFEVIEWPLGARDQVGLYLLGLLVQVGMVTLEAGLRISEKAALREVHLTEDVLTRIMEVKEYIALTQPMYGPCVEVPNDWVTPDNGGFHSARMRRLRPLFVSCHPTLRRRVREASMPRTLAAINALQRTAWKINEDVLRVVLKLSELGLTDGNPDVPGSGEIVTMTRKPKPPKPGWLLEGMNPEDFNEEQKATFRSWKDSVRDWHTSEKLLGIKWGRFYSATRAASFFRDYPALYFVYFADSRGRLYPMTTGISPQGSGLQKALLQFAEGKPLETESAIRWFHIHGANKYGFDKATLTDRFLFIHERREQWLHMAEDPINNREWTKADSPLEFLAWLLEYKRWNDTPGSFVSHLPVSMDGSCNGLQNLSAMLRDEIGGEATNLTANDTMQDIYKRVAEAAMARLTAMTCENPDDERIRLIWLSHGVARSVVKRSVMTTPYGVTQRSATDYVIEDYLKHSENPFDRGDYRRASVVLMKAVWPAIGDVVVKGRECMDWLRKAARTVIRSLDIDEAPVIWWQTPSGFIASQCYFEEEVHRINTKLAGCTKIRVLSETDSPSITSHASGLAPNFVHSMDASHLHLVASAAAETGIASLAMIHDDFGTHAADADRLFDLIRSQFVWMYENHDPVQDFADQYPFVINPPKKGTLDIKEVMRSDFFFS